MDTFANGGLSYLEIPEMAGGLVWSSVGGMLDKYGCGGKSLGAILATRDPLHISSVESIFGGPSDGHHVIIIRKFTQQHCPTKKET